MDALSKWVTRHRMTVGLLWLAITIVGIVLAPSVSSRLKSGNHVHSAAYTANQQIAEQYGGATADPGVLVLDVPPGQTVHSAGVAAELHAVDAQIARTAPTVRTVSYATTGSPTLVGTGGRSTIVLVYPSKQNADIDAAAVDTLTHAAKNAAPNLTVHGTSLKALEAGNATTGNSSVLSELVVGALGALLVLAWVFGSLLALLPLIMALVSVLTMQLLIYALTYVMPSSSPINPAVQYIVALLGLGLSIDYSLLAVTRWREERAAGRPNDEAIREAMKRAGHSVWFSGLVASLGLFAMIVVPNSLVRGIGISGLFIPSTATLVALTLLPVVLSKVGPRMDWPRRRAAGNASRFWTWWSHGVIRNRVAAAVVGLGILCALAGVAATINISQPTSAALASSGASTDGLHALQADGFSSGTLTTVPVWVPHAADAPTVVASLDLVSNLRGAVTPTDAAWRQSGTAVVIALPEHEVGSSQGGTSLADIRHTVPHGALVGGAGALSIDVVNSTYGAFPLLFAIVAVVTFVLLARGLKSILLPAKAVLLNALSVTASYGILVLVFQHGLGMQALWGTRSYGAVDSFAPVLIFGFLFGVSMDYEVRDVVANTPAHRLDIDLDTAPVVDTLGNPDHLQRLFRNIIDNAVRYAHRRVHITATTTVDSVQVEIDDDGPGIPPADRQRVFDRFVRLDSSRERNTGTTGLGLAIAHEIALTHHATSPSSTIQPGAPGSSSSSRTLPAAHRSQPIPSPARSLRNHPNGAPIRATRRRRRAGIMLVADVGFIGTRGRTELRPRQGVTSHWVTLSVRIT